MKLKSQINPDIYDFKITSNNFFKPLAFGNNLLYQIGRMHCNSKTVITTHTQLNYIELTVATDGKGTVITNGDKVAINAGDIYVSFPGDFHSILSDHDDPLKFDFLTIQTNDEMLKSDILQVAHHGLAVGRELEYPSITALYEKIAPRIAFWAINEKRFFTDKWCRDPSKTYHKFLFDTVGKNNYNNSYTTVVYMEDLSVSFEKYYDNAE